MIPLGSLRFFAVLLVWFAPSAVAQYAITDRLSGFDRRRIERSADWGTRPSEVEALPEAAKLVYQLRRIDWNALRYLPAGRPAEIGDAVRLRGTVTEIAAAGLPAELAELLEMSQLFRLTVQVDGKDRYVITQRIPHRWIAAVADHLREPGKSVASVEAWSCGLEGVVAAVDEAGEAVVVAAPALHWYPTSLQQAGSPGIALLARQGFDARLLDELQTAQQQPLKSEEGDAFYGMLAAAGKLDLAAAPPPQPLSTVELLKKPAELAGHWLRVDLETVRVMRVAVTSPRAAERLGQDHYWQLDAMGSLGETLVTVEGEPTEETFGTNPPRDAEFANRYPVSIATLRLPPELRTALAQESGEGAVMGMLRRPIRVDGFYYRLWSYDSEFMRRQADRQQFGPLLMASRIGLRSVSPGDPRGAAMIGWLAAGIFLVGMVAIVIALGRAGRRDAEVTRRRRAQQAEDVRFPST